jgi:hypothetical protein
MNFGGIIPVILKLDTTYVDSGNFMSTVPLAKEPFLPVSQEAGRSPDLVRSLRLAGCRGMPLLEE